MIKGMMRGPVGSENKRLNSFKLLCAVLYVPSTRNREFIRQELPLIIKEAFYVN